MTPPDDAVLDALTSEGVKRAVRRIRTSSAFFRDQAKTWNSISARHNRDLDNQTADALDAAATILEFQIDHLRALLAEHDQAIYVLRCADALLEAMTPGKDGELTDAETARLWNATREKIADFFKETPDA